MERSENSGMKTCEIPCPLCGSQDIGRRYYKRGDETQPPGLNSARKGSEYVDRAATWRWPALQDCVVHHCRCCQYDWDTGVEGEVDNYVEGKLYWHEALDRSHVACDHFHEYVESHPTITHEPELKVAAEKVTDCLQEFYQLVGRKYCDFERRSV
jgi:hypothetical protein